MTIKILKRRKRNNETFTYNEEPDEQDSTITLERLKSILGHSVDIKFQTFCLNKKSGLTATLVYIEALVSMDLISNYVLRPLLEEPEFEEIHDENQLIMKMRTSVYFPEQLERGNINQVIKDVLSGFIAIIFDNIPTAITLGVQGYEKRSVSEPTDENVIKGAKDSFIEDIKTNNSLIRRKLKSPHLTITEVTIGRQSQTPVCIVYMNNIANKQIVQEVKKRLENIQVDQIIHVGFIEEYIVDHKYTFFPQVFYTERPDRLCHHVVLGRVGIIIDGLPSALIVPVNAAMFIRSSEDYSFNYLMASAIRFFRFLMIITTLLLPGFYISVTTFHQEMIPTELAISIASAKEGVPFPSFVEVLVLLMAFELLTEAGLRMPKPIAQTVSVVGGLIVGQAVVEAKLVSPAVIVAIALTAIAGFTIPNEDFTNAVRGWRFLLAILSSVLGLVGLGLGFLALLYELCSMECFGVPYLAPLVAMDGKEAVKDTLIRARLETIKNRPMYLRTINKKRQK